jgi:hypothetical protein
MVADEYRKEFARDHIGIEHGIAGVEAAFALILSSTMIFRAAAAAPNRSMAGGLPQVIFRLARCGSYWLMARPRNTMSNITTKTPAYLMEL